jgi:mannose-6-phosphate isomerase-like protein (cupin superfamily)
MADRIEVKSHDHAEDVRTPDKSRVEVVKVGPLSLGRLTFQPGWRWSDCIKPVVGTDSCQVHHVGYAVSGRITVRLATGDQATIQSGDSYDIPPGHDAWVEGNEPFVGIEVQSADEFAKPRS